MSVYEIVTDKILNMLEQGTVPWRMPWVAGNQSPINLVSGKQYRGINPILLNFEAISRGFGTNSWLSWNQVKRLGGSIKEGEQKRYTIVVFFKMLKVSSENDHRSNQSKDCEEKLIPLLRYYKVYNLDQTTGLNIPVSESSENDFQEIDGCEQLILSWKDRPKIVHEEPRAYYIPSQDLVNMPKKILFESEESYYATLFHECAHATGHRSRLNRKGIEDFHAFGDEVYSKEELIAEIAASYLCGHSGIENTTLPNQASYIESWLKTFQNDKRMVVIAASQAQKAAEYILGK